MGGIFFDFSVHNSSSTAISFVGGEGRCWFEFGSGVAFRAFLLFTRLADAGRVEQKVGQLGRVDTRSCRNGITRSGVAPYFAAPIRGNCARVYRLPSFAATAEKGGLQYWGAYTQASERLMFFTLASNS
jgi:hypothetical protein